MSESVYKIEVQIKNSDGLHMRPAMQFVDVSSRFECDIKVTNGDTTVDAKSIMQMTMLAATYGTVLTICADGSDSAQAIDALRELVEQDLFGEPSGAAAEGGQDG